MAIYSKLEYWLVYAEKRLLVPKFVDEPIDQEYFENFYRFFKHDKKQERKKRKEPDFHHPDKGQWVRVRVKENYGN